MIWGVKDHAGKDTLLERSKNVDRMTLRFIHYSLKTGRLGNRQKKEKFKWCYPFYKSVFFYVCSE